MKFYMRYNPIEDASLLGMIRLFEDNVTIHNDYIEVADDYYANFKERYYTYLEREYYRFSKLYRIRELDKEIKNFKQGTDEEVIKAKKKELEQYIKEIITSKASYIKNALKNSKDKRNTILTSETFKHAYNIGYLYQVILKKFFCAKQQISELPADLFEKNINKGKKKENAVCHNCDKIFYAKGKYNKSFKFINNFGYDIDKKKGSYAWNGKETRFLCDDCRLLLLCFPFGFSKFSKDYIFIDYNHSIIEMKKVNDALLLQSKQAENKYNSSYANMLIALRKDRKVLTDFDLANTTIVSVSNLSSEIKFSEFNKEKSKKIKSLSNKLIKDKSFLEYLSSVFYTEGETRNYIFNGLLEHITERNYILLLTNRLLYAIIKNEKTNVNSFILSLLLCIEKSANMDNNYLNISFAEGKKLRAGYDNTKKADSLALRLISLIKNNKSFDIVNELLLSYNYQSKAVPKILINSGLNAQDQLIIYQNFVNGLITKEKKEEEL